MAAKSKNLSVIESIVRGGVWISIWGGILLWLAHMNFFSYIDWDYEWVKFVIYGFLALASITALLYLFRKKGANPTAIIWSVFAVVFAGIFILLTATYELFPNTYIIMMVAMVGTAGALYIGFMIVSAIIKGIIMGVIKSVRGGEERRRAGSSKQCPYCGHHAPLDAEICPHCNTHFPMERERKELIGKLKDTGSPTQARVDALRSLSTLHLLDRSTCLSMLRSELREPERRPHLCAELLMALREVDAREAVRIAKRLKRHRIPEIRHASADVLSEDYGSESSASRVSFSPFLQVLLGISAFVALALLLTVSILLPKAPKGPELPLLPESGVEKTVIKQEGLTVSTEFMSGREPGKDFLWFGNLPYIWQGEEKIDYETYTESEGVYVVEVNGRPAVKVNYKEGFDFPLPDTIAQAIITVNYVEKAQERFFLTIMSRDGDSLMYYHARQINSLTSVPDLDYPYLKLISLGINEIYDYDPLRTITAGSVKELRVLNLKTDAVSDDELRWLNDMPGLRAFNLDGSKITGQGIEYLYQTPYLRELGLTNSLLGLGTLKHIASFVNLRGLDLSSGFIWNGQLKYLSNLPHLSYLDLSENLITDNAIKHLAKIENLRSLNLSNTYISDEGLRQLASLSSIEELYLEEINTRGEGLAWLANLKNLRVLDLNNNDLYSSDIRWIGGLDNLEKLNLSNNDIGLKGIIQIAKLKNLRNLYIHNNGLDDEEVKALSELTNLEVLDISESYHFYYDWETLLELANLPKLKRLYLDGFIIEDMGQEGLSRLKRALPACTIYEWDKPVGN
ncbi:hypothetical protein JXM67_07965 [candidate division WOR-3 bacterium]|nr:hypothetical protein [candidate division WOR-3 bacterium]